MLSFFFLSISPRCRARSRNPFHLLPEDVLGRQADNPRSGGLQGVKAPRRKVSARHAIEIEIQMRPRGYSNSVRQPLFCISGPTQLPSGTQIIYIAFSILSLPPFSVSLSLSLSARRSFASLSVSLICQAHVFRHRIRVRSTTIEIR